VATLHCAFLTFFFKFATFTLNVAGLKLPAKMCALTLDCHEKF
jgi:hypothetical protein